MQFTMLALLVLVSFSATAQQSQPALPPAPFHFDGKWLCSGAMGNGKAHTSSFQGSTVLKGTWVRLEEADITPATGYVAEYLIGWDATAKKVVEFDANNFFAAAYSSDEGWKSGTLTLTSPIDSSAKASYAQNRFIFRIDAQDAFTMDWQVRRSPDSEWKPGDHLACSRAVTASKIPPE